jgi:hypothetical protein
MQLEHCHVEKDGYQDQTESPCEKMLRPCPWTDTKITQQQPQLQDGARTNRRNGEKAYPFAGYDGTQRQTGKNKPRPPLFGKWLLFILIRKAHKKEGGESREKYEGRIQ